MRNSDRHPKAKATQEATETHHMTFMQDPLNKDNYAPTKADLVAAEAYVREQGEKGSKTADESAAPKGNECKDAPANSRKRMIIAGVAAAVIIAIAIILTGAYIATANSYDGRFLPNTTVQSVDISGMDVEEAIEAVTSSFKTSEITLDENGESVVITGEELGLAPVPGTLDELLSKQDKWDWLASSLTPAKDEAIGVTYDEELLSQIVGSLQCVDPDQRTLPVDATIEYSDEEDAFVTIDAVDGNLVDAGALTEAIAKMIADGGGTIDVTELYAKPALVSDSEEIVTAINEANRIVSKHITYNIDMIDDAETLTKEQIASFLMTDGEMDVTVNEDAVRAWLREVGQEYDTAGDEIRYTTAYGKEAVLPTGVIGWETDEAGMLPIVVENLLGDESEVDQDFVYQQEGLFPKGEKADFTGRYVDVDITEQKTRLVENGQVVDEFACVTGNADGTHDTPVGVWDILEKAHNYKMTGSDESGDGKPDYVTYTDTWCRFTWQGHGLHQLYRGSWSPSAYVSGNGSHGCVNLKNADAQAVYDFVDYGTLVLVHM